MKTKVKVSELLSDKTTAFKWGKKQFTLYIGKNSYGAKSEVILAHIILYKSAFPKGERNISLYVSKESNTLVNRDIRNIIGGEK